MEHKLPSSINADLIKDIIDVSIPKETIAWWPQTTGWKILLLIGILLVIRLAIKQFKRYKANLYRREALKAIDIIKRQPSNQQPRTLFFIIKSVASYIDNNIANQTGDALLLFLDAKIKDKPLFFNELGKKWQQSILDPDNQNIHLTEKETHHLITICEHWIDTHQIEINVTSKKDKL